MDSQLLFLNFLIFLSLGTWYASNIMPPPPPFIKHPPPITIFLQNPDPMTFIKPPL